MCNFRTGFSMRAGAIVSSVVNFSGILRAGGAFVSLSTTFSFHRTTVHRLSPAKPFAPLWRLASGIVFLGVFGVFGGVARSSPPEPGGEKALVRRFESRYRAARSLQASFLERYSERGKTVRVDAGTAYFRRPGKMRWNYESPEKNVFVVDGKTAWFYVPADRTVTKMRAKESGDWRTPLALLAGEMKISRVCSSVELAAREKPVEPGHALLLCRLRGDEKDAAGAQRAYFEIVEATGELARIIVAEAGGMELEFQFTGWRMNPPLADSIFRFEAPLGVAIVNGEMASGGEKGQEDPRL